MANEVAVQERRNGMALTAGRCEPNVRSYGAAADYADQIRRLTRFLSPQVARFILSCDDQELLQCRRREITVVFCDLRGYTAFAETTPPDEVMTVLRMYHEALGRVITDFDGTLERFTGDGIMVYFDDPPVETQAARAVGMAVRMRERLRTLRTSWQERGHRLDVGIGIALGPASVGTVGFEGRYDYAAIGPVTNLGSRLCAHAGPDQILISHRVYTAVRHLIDAEPVGRLALRGFECNVAAYSVRSLTADRQSSSAALESWNASGYDTARRA